MPYSVDRMAVSERVEEGMEDSLERIMMRWGGVRKESQIDRTSETESQCARRRGVSMWWIRTGLRVEEGKLTVLVCRVLGWLSSQGPRASASG